MTSVFKPLKSVNSLILVGIMATVGMAATAQPAVPVAPATSAVPAAKPGPQAGERMGRHDPARMQAHVAKRQAELKAKLALTPAQESAWTAFTAAMQPPVHGARPSAEQRAEFDKLNTPERIDKMRALRTQRMAEMNAAMDKRGDATKTFYAALNAEQKKAFDSQRMGRGGAGHGGGMGMGQGGHHGQHHRG